jgi:hypothetical protein
MPIAPGGQRYNFPAAPYPPTYLYPYRALADSLNPHDNLAVWFVNAWVTAHAIAIYEDAKNQLVSATVHCDISGPLDKNGRYV